MDENEVSDQGIKARHKKLAGVVKGVHANLRKKYRSSGDHEKVWQEHCQDKELLSEYADAMHHLATDIWTKHPETRIDWCRNVCMEFFHQGGLKKVLDKEERRKNHHTDRLSANGATSVGSDSTSSGESLLLNSVGSYSSSAKEIKITGLEFSHKINAVDNKVLNEGEGASVQKLEIIQNQINSHPMDVLDSTESTGDECSSCVENEMIFGPPDGSFECNSEHALAEYQPRKYNTISLPFQEKIRLLDVGSCFNPFQDCEGFVSVGVDISPAVPSVFFCDFLTLETTEPLQLAEDTISTFIHNLKTPIEILPREAFHVLVFSLLLEYFPSPYQRWLCCQKAQELLMLNGLLLIITPDSSGQHRNAPMIKSWKQAIESMGFSRWKYVKLEHLHCMAFRKIIKEDSDENLVSEIHPDMLYIPQDSHDTADSENNSASGSCYFFGSLPRPEEDFLQAFQELPDSLE